MKIFIIICCTFVSCIAGYILRLGIEGITRKELIFIEQKFLFSSFSICCFTTTIFLIALTILVLAYNLEMPL